MELNKQRDASLWVKATAVGKDWISLLYGEKGKEIRDFKCWSVRMEITERHGGELSQ